MGIPEIRSLERTERYESDSKVVKSLDELSERLSPDVLRSYVDRGSLPKRILEGLSPPNAVRNRLFSSERIEKVEAPSFSIGSSAAEDTARAVGEFLKEAPGVLPLKKGGEVRILVTLDAATGTVESLQHGPDGDGGAQAIPGGKLALHLGVRFDPKSKVVRLIVDPAAKTALHRMGGKELSAEMARDLASLHGKALAVERGESAGSPLATGVLSLGGLLTLPHQVLEVGAVATAAVLLGRFLFAKSPYVFSFLRRLRHRFGAERAVDDWAKKAESEVHLFKAQARKQLAQFVRKQRELGQDFSGAHLVIRNNGLLSVVSHEDVLSKTLIPGVYVGIRITGGRIDASGVRESIARLRAYPTLHSRIPAYEAVLRLDGLEIDAP